MNSWKTYRRLSREGNKMKKKTNQEEEKGGGGLFSELISTLDTDKEGITASDYQIGRAHV